MHSLEWTIFFFYHQCKKKFDFNSNNKPLWSFQCRRCHRLLLLCCAAPLLFAEGWNGIMEGCQHTSGPGSWNGRASKLGSDASLAVTGSPPTLEGKHCICFDSGRNKRGKIHRFHFSKRFKSTVYKSDRLSSSSPTCALWISQNNVVQWVPLCPPVSRG